jgi:hypothetical protein
VKRKLTIGQQLLRLGNAAAIVIAAVTCGVFWVRGAAMHVKSRAKTKAEHVPAVPMPQVTPEQYRADDSTVWN